MPEKNKKRERDIENKIKNGCLNKGIKNLSTSYTGEHI